MLQKHFTPSAFLEEMSQAQGFSMDAAVNSVLSGSYGATINISMGPLAGRYPVSDALTAPIDDYLDTQRKMLMAVVGLLPINSCKCCSANLTAQKASSHDNEPAANRVLVPSCPFVVMRPEQLLMKCGTSCRGWC